MIFRSGRNLTTVLLPILAGVMSVSSCDADDLSSSSFTPSSGQPLQYWISTPSESAAAKLPMMKLPMMLFLHGGGESGDDLERVKKHGPPKLVSEGKSFPFVLLAPPNPSESQFWDDQKLMQLVNHIVKLHNIDPNRIYLAGMSRGGYGVWRLVIQNPNRFAAMIAICGGGDPPYAKKIKDLPIWVFHGAKDPLIPISESQAMVDELKRLGSPVKFTIYPDAQHDAWTETFNNPDVYDWMLKQRLR